MVRVEVPAALLAWASDRSGLARDDLSRRFPKLTDWESGAVSPTLKQLEDFASATHTPVGYFFLPGPPDIQLPLPDFRTRRAETVRQPSPDLLDTLFLSEQRQEWYRDYARINNDDPVAFVGSLTMATGVAPAARVMREALGFGVGECAATWSESFRRLADQAEDLGILVMVSGVVGSNTHRQLDPGEFLGFALADEYAPAVFINGASAKAAQIFTLTHELVHIWLGQSALDDPDVGGLGAVRDNEVERWCDQVAAEILVPLDALAQQHRRTADLTENSTGWRAPSRSARS